MGIREGSDFLLEQQKKTECLLRSTHEKYEYPLYFCRREQTMKETLSAAMKDCEEYCSLLKEYGRVRNLLFSPRMGWCHRPYRW